MGEIEGRDKQGVLEVQIKSSRIFGGSGFLTVSVF